MVASYYVATYLRYGYFLNQLLLAWSATALLLAPPFAAIVWQARATGWRAALSVALPVGLLLYEAYSLRWVLHLHATQFVFNIIAAAALILLLPVDSQRLRTLLLIPVVMAATHVVLAHTLPAMGWFF